MPAIIKSANIINACQLRISGQTINSIAVNLGFRNRKTIDRLLKLGGLRGMYGIRPGQVIPDYLSGISENAIAKRFNVSRTVIRKILIDHNIPIRDNATANRNMMLNRTPEENRRNIKAAHLATKGKRQSPQFREKLALSKERNGTGITSNEAILTEKLKAKGFKITPQKAVECYNIDIAIPKFRIAVEIFGGGWHAHGYHARSFRKRFDLLLDRGWIPIIIWIDDKIPVLDGCVEYIISLSQRISGDKSIRGGEHVILGNGKPTPRGKTNLDYRAVIGGDKGGNFIRGIDGRFRVDTSSV